MAKRKKRTTRSKDVKNVLKSTQGKVVLLVSFLIVILFASSVSFSVYDNKFQLAYGSSINYQHTDSVSVLVGGTVDATVLNTEGWKLFVDMQRYLSYSKAALTTCKLVHSVSGTVLLSGILSSYGDPNALEDYKTAYYYFDIATAYKETNTYYILFEGELNLASTAFYITGMTTADDSPAPVADTTAPLITISAPLPNIIVPIETTVAITFTASDANGIVAYRILIDGTEVATTASYDWDVTGYAIGTHEVRCEAMDPSDNIGHEEIFVSVGELGEIPKLPEFVSKPDDTISMFSNETIDLIWVVADDNPATYNLYQNGTLVKSGVAAIEEFTFTATLEKLDVGTYLYEFEFFDDDANTITHIVTVTVGATSWMENPLFIIGIVIVALVVLGGGVSRRS